MPPDLQDTLLNQDEVRTVAGIVANYINDQGSIMNDYDLIGKENVLREKLGLPLIKGEDEMSDEELLDWVHHKPQCTCHPMPQGTNPNCPRHGLAK